MKFNEFQHSSGRPIHLSLVLLSLSVITSWISSAPKAQAACAMAPESPAVFVAPNGSDSASGTETRPYLTLVKAIKSIRGTSVKRIYLRGGTYKIASPIYLSNEDNNILISSYPCERAALDGGVDLKSWQSLGNGIYSTVVSASASYKDFAVGGVRQVLGGSKSFDAAKPTEGWDWVGVQPVLDDAGKVRLDAFRMRPNQLNPADLPSLSGLAVESFDWGHQYQSWNSVKSIDWSNNIIYLYGELKNDPARGTYRMINNYHWLRKNGEFAWDWGTTKTLYTKQASADFQKTAVLPRLTNLMKIRGASDIRILNINFQNTIADGDALDIVDSKRISIGGCEFKMVGTGISLIRSSENRIAGNNMTQLGGSGVDIFIGSANKVYANKITSVGQVNMQASGISLAGSSDTYISSNNITDSARYGISHKDWSPETINWRNKIENNWVYNTCKSTGDCGAIETLGRQNNQSGVVIRGNIVQNFNGMGGMPLAVGFKGFGLYIDDRSSGMLIENNFVLNKGPAWASIFVHGGDNNIVRNNHVVADDINNKFIKIENVFNGYDSAGNRQYDRTENLTIEKNIIYYSIQNPDYSGVGASGKLTVDRNLLVRTARFNELGSVLDAQSIMTNTSPFLNVSTGDFRLKPNSEAAKLGITDVPWNSVGPANYKSSTTLPKFW